jgi:tetratricopeptide (TPR) repeat protein
MTRSAWIPSVALLLGLSLPALSGAAAAALNGAAPERDYEAGMKALAAKDFDTALARLEAAVAADPDSLRYASEYRQAVIRAGAYDRAIDFFEKLVAAHSRSANAYLNYGYAYVDKIPSAGSITQVLLANTALAQFSRSIELEPTWLALYTRGNSYLYWPAIFGRAPMGIADLEKAADLVRKTDKRRKVHARTWVALGDGHWRLSDAEKARAMWSEGLKLFPGEPQLTARLERKGADLDAYITAELDPNKRVDTDLKSLWAPER